MYQSIYSELLTNTSEKYCYTDINIFFQKILPLPIAIPLLFSIACAKEILMYSS